MKAKSGISSDKSSNIDAKIKRANSYYKKAEQCFKRKDEEGYYYWKDLADEIMRDIDRGTLTHSNKDTDVVKEINKAVTEVSTNFNTNITYDRIEQNNEYINNFYIEDEFILSFTDKEMNVYINLQDSDIYSYTFERLTDILAEKF